MYNKLNTKFSFRSHFHDMVDKEKDYLVIYKLWQNLSKKNYKLFSNFINDNLYLISLSSVIPLTSVLIEPTLLVNNNYYPLLEGILGINSSGSL